MKQIKDRVIYLIIFLILIARLSQNKKKKDKKRKNNILDSVRSFYKGRELVVDDFKSGLFPLKSTNASKIANSSCTIKSR